MFIINETLTAKKYLVFPSLLADQENLQCKKKKKVCTISRWIHRYLHVHVHEQNILLELVCVLSDIVNTSEKATERLNIFHFMSRKIFTKYSK